MYIYILVTILTFTLRQIIVTMVFTNKQNEHTVNHMTDSRTSKLEKLFHLDFEF